MGHLDVEVIRTGSSHASPPRQHLRAGPLLVTLEEGALRSLRLVHAPQHEILRGIYAAVRDHNWNTIVPRFLSYEVEAQEDAFRVHFVAEYVTDEVDFIWQGTIKGSSAGEIIFTFDGQARRAFRKNRVGLCVLHPLELAGAELEVETPTGTLYSVFPVAISPHQPFTDIVVMRYACAAAVEADVPLRMELRLSGELFEMEDQRNWTDASYKTYCTPLRLPCPGELAAGERVLEALEREQPQNIRYAVCPLPDGVSFVTLVISDDDGEDNPLFALPEYQAFREGFKAWIAEPPTAEKVTVGTSYRF